VERGAKRIGIVGDKTEINYAEIVSKAFLRRRAHTWRLLSSRM
jgi:hypothetical protein